MDPKFLEVLNENYLQIAKLLEQIRLLKEELEYEKRKNGRENRSS
jgi:hypothetical protein